jgi:hypothetical protein
MASSGVGVGHLSSTSLVFGEETSTPSRNGRDRKGLRTPQAVKEEITGNSRILAEPGWDSVTSPLWTRVVLSDVLGGKDVVEGHDGLMDGRFCLLGIGRNGQIL